MVSPRRTRSQTSNKSGSSQMSSRDGREAPLTASVEPAKSFNSLVSDAIRTHMVSIELESSHAEGAVASGSGVSVKRGSLFSRAGAKTGGAKELNREEIEKLADAVKAPTSVVPVRWPSTDAGPTRQLRPAASGLRVPPLNEAASGAPKRKRREPGERAGQAPQRARNEKRHLFGKLRNVARRDSGDSEASDE